MDPISFKLFFITTKEIFSLSLSHTYIHTHTHKDTHTHTHTADQSLHYDRITVCKTVVEKYKRFKSSRTSL